jgi:hypothetical protein
MKRAFLLMVVLALLVMSGFAQTPDTGSNADPVNVKGCLSGPDGNYTVAEDGSSQIFKITTSSVDLKPHVGQDVKLLGHKASGAVNSGAPDNSFAVTELTMISEHCAAAAAAPVATVNTSSEGVIAPATDALAPSATIGTPAADTPPPAATVSPSSATAIVPAADATAPSTPVSTPAVDAPAPAPVVSPSSAIVSTPAADAARATRLSAHPGRESTTRAAAAVAPAVTASPSTEPVSPLTVETATPAATASSPAEAVTAPAAAATTPTVTHGGGSLWLLISFVVLVIVLGTMAPVVGRWRKRKILERTGSQNLSFTNKTNSEQEKSEPRKVA